MTIQTYLDLSTAHLTRETMDTLHSATDRTCYDKGWPAMTIAPFDCGAFVTVPALYEAEQWAALPADLAEVLSHARSTGIHLLRFDADGEVLDDLPTYEW